MNLRLQATIRGATLIELNANAVAACQRFYGATPFQIIEQSWAAATAETFDPDGNVTGFMFNMEAEPASTV